MALPPRKYAEIDPRVIEDDKRSFLVENFDRLGIAGSVSSAASSSAKQVMIGRANVARAARAVVEAAHSLPQDSPHEKLEPILHHLQEAARLVVEQCRSALPPPEPIPELGKLLIEVQQLILLFCFSKTLLHHILSEL
jgi:hypothetical protein